MTVLKVLSAICAILGTGLVGGTVWAWRTWRKVDLFLQDWNGTEERPGVPARAGVLVRLQRLDAVADQFERNGGATTRDQIDRIERIQMDLAERLTQHITWHVATDPTGTVARSFLEEAARRRGIRPEGGTP